jgi:hypothetical protein
MSRNTEIFVFNMEAKRPACVLLAAAMGGNPSFAHEFNADHWIIDGPEVDGLRRYGPMTREEVRGIAKRLGMAQ